MQNKVAPAKRFAERFKRRYADAGAVAYVAGLANAAQKPKAIKYLERAAILLPQDTDIRLALGQLQLGTRNPEQGAKLLTDMASATSDIDLDTRIAGVLIEAGRFAVLPSIAGAYTSLDQVEKLSPRVRAESLDEAITTVPYDAISAFLSRPSVISARDRDTAPYILTARKGHLIGAAGMDMYVRNSQAAQGTVMSVMHVGEPLRDPDDGEVLGYEGLYVGQGRVDRTGDPATVRLIESAREALEGDLLFANDRQIPLHFIPRGPESSVEGQIIAVVDGLSLIGQYMVVVVNRGTRHGLEPGHVLAIWQTGEVVRDTVKGKKSFGEKVKLPDEYAGQMMIFDTRERLSFGLIVNAQSEISKFDTVRNP